MKHYSFAMDGRIIAVLAATTSTFDRYLHIAVGEMVQSTERILKMHCHIGVSRIREHLGECHEAYRGAMSALGYCTPGESGIHYIADEERDNTMDMELAAECVTQMENLIRGGSREELENYLKDVFGKLEVQQDAALKCKFLIFRMSSALIRIAYTVTEDSALLQRLPCWKVRYGNPGIVSRHFAWKYGNWSMRARKRAARSCVKRPCRSSTRSMGIRPCLWWASATAFM